MNQDYYSRFTQPTFRGNRLLQNLKKTRGNICNVTRLETYSYRQRYEKFNGCRARNILTDRISCRCFKSVYWKVAIVIRISILMRCTFARWNTVENIQQDLVSAFEINRAHSGVRILWFLFFTARYKKSLHRVLYPTHPFEVPVEILRDISEVGFLQRSY